jgi:hypothetical protein
MQKLINAAGLAVGRGQSFFYLFSRRLLLLLALMRMIIKKRENYTARYSGRWNLHEMMNINAGN